MLADEPFVIRADTFPGGRELGRIGPNGDVVMAPELRAFVERALRAGGLAAVVDEVARSRGWVPWCDNLRLTVASVRDAVASADDLIARGGADAIVRAHLVSARRTLDILLDTRPPPEVKPPGGV